VLLFLARLMQCLRCVWAYSVPQRTVSEVSMVQWVVRDWQLASIGRGWHGVIDAQSAARAFLGIAVQQFTGVSQCVYTVAGLRLQSLKQCL
jgi:hypothetical protein